MGEDFSLNGDILLSLSIVIFLLSIGFFSCFTHMLIFSLKVNDEITKSQINTLLAICSGLVIISALLYFTSMDYYEQKSNNLVIINANGYKPEQHDDKLEWLISSGKSDIIIVHSNTNNVDHLSFKSMFSKMLTDDVTVIGVATSKDSCIDTDKLILLTLSRISVLGYNRAILVSDERTQNYELIRAPLPLNEEIVKSILSDPISVEYLTKTRNIESCISEISGEMSFGGQLIQKKQLTELSKDLEISSLKNELLK